MWTSVTQVSTSVTGMHCVQISPEVTCAVVLVAIREMDDSVMVRMQTDRSKVAYQLLN